MNRVLVTMDHMQDAPYMHLTNMEDLAEYIEATNKELAKTINKVMHSNVSVERWDHLLSGKNLGDSSLMVSWLTCKYGAENKSPLLEVDNVLNGKFRTMAEKIADGEHILANYVGGYMPYMEDCMSMKPDETYVAPLNYKIAKEASYINLENDPEIENHTKAWFYRNNASISYVVNLRDVIGEDLVNILNRFHMNGGHTVYVYTTGIDVSEMYQYASDIISSDINNVMFEFNSGISDEILEVIDYLKKRNIKVSYKEV